MSTTKTTRKIAFDRKRAARFESRNVRVDNIVGATVGLQGKSPAKCALCDHDILWQYTLHVQTSEEIGRWGSLAEARLHNLRMTIHEFAPVGSSCIKSWADSLPVSEAQAEIVAHLKLAVEEATAIKARFRRINALVKREDITETQGRALVAFFSGPPVIRSDSFLADVAAKAVDKAGFVGRQWEAWERALGRAYDNYDAREANRALLDRAHAVRDDRRSEGLSESDLEAFEDILARVEERGFATDRQRYFFTAIVERAEALSVEDTDTDYDDLPL